MVDPGEVVNRTLIREFAEEALSNDLAFNKSDVKARNIFEAKLAKFFKTGIEVKVETKKFEKKLFCISLKVYRYCVFDLLIFQRFIEVMLMIHATRTTHGWKPKHAIFTMNTQV